MSRVTEAYSCYDGPLQTGSNTKSACGDLLSRKIAFNGTYLATLYQQPYNQAEIKSMCT